MAGLWLAIAIVLLVAWWKIHKAIAPWLKRQQQASPDAHHDLSYRSHEFMWLCVAVAVFAAEVVVVKEFIHAVA